MNFEKGRIKNKKGRNPRLDSDPKVHQLNNYTIHRINRLLYHSYGFGNIR